MPPRTPTAFQEFFERIRRSLGASRSKDFLRFLPGTRSASGPELLSWIEQSVRVLPEDRLPQGSVVLVQVSHPLTLVVLLPALWRHGLVPCLAEVSAPVDPVCRGDGPAFDALVQDAPGAVGAGAPLELPDLPPLRMVLAPRARRPALPPGTVLVRTTSGTTGRPRGIALSAAQLMADARNILSSLRIDPSTRALGAVPMGHAYGFSTLLTPLLCFGIPLTLLESPLPEHFRAALRSRPLFFPGVPVLFELLLSSLDPPLLARLNPAISAGAPLPLATALRFKEKTGVPLRNFYGSSECGAIACDRSRQGELLPGCVGTPLNGVRVSLERLRAGPGRRRGDTTGRIVVTGRAVAIGYAGDARRSSRFRGRFQTSDVGRRDRKGRFFLEGRLDRMINVGGRKVFPEAVERVLASFPGVREAAVLAVEDSLRGEAVGAAVAGGRGLLEADLLEHCRAYLPPHGLPRRCILLASLPRTARGKVDLERLRRLLSASVRAGARGGQRPRHRHSSSRAMPRKAAAER